MLDDVEVGGSQHDAVKENFTEDGERVVPSYSPADIYFVERLGHIT